MWWEFTSFYPNWRLRPIQRGSQPSFPVTEVTRMLKGANEQVWHLIQKCLHQILKRLHFPPKNLRITATISSSQLPALFPRLLDSCHHLSRNTWEHPLRLPAFSCPLHSTLPSAARVGSLTRQSLRTKPGFYLGVHNSPYCLVWRKDVLPEVWLIGLRVRLSALTVPGLVLICVAILSVDLWEKVFGFFSKHSSLLLSIGHEIFITIMVQSPCLSHGRLIPARL